MKKPYFVDDDRNMVCFIDKLQGQPEMKVEKEAAPTHGRSQLHGPLPHCSRLMS